MLKLTAQSKDGKLLISNDTLDAVAKTFGDCDIEIIFDKRSEQKNLRQLGYYFAGIVEGAANFWGWSKEDMHEHLKAVCNRKELVSKTGEISYIGASTRTLSKREYAQFITRAIQYLAEQGYDCGEPIKSWETQ